MINNFYRKNNRKDIALYKKGSLLLELLIAISVIAIILSFSANALFLSMKGNKISGDRDTASALASETLEAVRSVVEENFQNIYGLTKSTGRYYPVLSGNKWVLSSGDETINMNSVSYIRYVTVDNVSRDPGTRNIQSNYSGTDDDPSTQKVTVTVSWVGGNPIYVSEYFFRWKNKICGQSGWTTGGTGNTIKNCVDTTYDIIDPEVDITGGTLKLN